jgi:hypothetical protein
MIENTEDSGPIEPRFVDYLAFEDLPIRCQRCLMSGINETYLRIVRRSRAFQKRRA